MAIKVATDARQSAVMDPMLPPETDRELSDLAYELSCKASRLGGRAPAVVLRDIGDLVRAMNCYYSNLIEDHNTYPRDIDRALADDFSAQPERRALQQEAKAHIEVQRDIDAGRGAAFEVSRAYLRGLHRQFCERLPPELLQVAKRDTGETVAVRPGALRTQAVTVGRHRPPPPAQLERCLKRFERAYDRARLPLARQLVAVAASHHRLLWIHPFTDGNGRVARLFAHAWLRALAVGNPLWSVARGLARSVSRYKHLLMAADEIRQGGADGRGALSAEALGDFCRYFLQACIDQVEFMESLLRLDAFSARLRRWVAAEAAAGRLPAGACALLREAFVVGEFERGRVAELTNYKDRRARETLYLLLQRKLLLSDTPRGKVRLGFPLEVVPEWFPGLYPAEALAAA